MKHIVGFSGGIDSQAVARWCINRFGAENVILLSKDIGEMIDEGWLCQIRGRRIQTKTDISRVRSKMGDFAENELAEAVNNADRNATAVKAYLEYGENKRCMVFAVDVDHTLSLRDAFLARGISAEAVTGTTPKEERRGAASRFRSGETKVLVNCMVYTYGYDEPAIEVIIMAKPSKSSVYFVQACGRGLRPSPDTRKTHCLIIDLVDNSEKHSVMTIPSLFGLPGSGSVRSGVLAGRTEPASPKRGVEVDTGDISAIRGFATDEGRVPHKYHQRRGITFNWAENRGAEVGHLKMLNKLKNNRLERST